MLNKNNKSVQSHGNLATAATLTQSQTNLINFNDDICDMRLNQVRRLNKQQEHNLGSIKSRLNHIQHQDQYVQRNISKTQDEIDHILRIKQRKYTEIQRKKWVAQLREQMYSETAQRVNLSRSERMKRSQRIELTRQIYSDVHKQLNREFRNNHQMAKQQLQEEINHENRLSHKMIRSAHLNHLQERSRQLENKYQQGFTNYQNKLLYESQLLKYRSEEIQDLEQVETQLLTKLKLTQSKDRSISAKKEEISRIPAECITPKLFKLTS
ncbi:hypothetical protein pb186bvf_012136 [Paramecium bursaria]